VTPLIMGPVCLISHTGLVRRASPFLGPDIISSLYRDESTVSKFSSAALPRTVRHRHAYAKPPCGCVPTAAVSWMTSDFLRTNFTAASVTLE